MNQEPKSPLILSSSTFPYNKHSAYLTSTMKTLVPGSSFSKTAKNLSQSSIDFLLRDSRVDLALLSAPRASIAAIWFLQETQRQSERLPSGSFETTMPSGHFKHLTPDEKVPISVDLDSAGKDSQSISLPSIDAFARLSSLTDACSSSKSFRPS